MLNPDQKQAVETLNGPVLVIAGPGTGKTQVLSLRIAEILKKCDGIETGNILCLTYTNSGVVAMRKRLLQFIGPEAHRVQIHTFHSFCNQIIQENAEYFGAKESENISELQQYECIENILDALPANHLFFHKSSYHAVKDLLGLFLLLKSENWSVEEVQKATEEYLADLPNREEFQYKRKYKEFAKGDANPTKIANAKEKMKRLLAAVELFPQYENFLKKNGAYDFADMIAWVIHAFDKNDTLLARYQEQFQYILVDEFQDTNGSQKRIIDLLCSYWEDPNIFVVGDDDQSIYRFQGANMRNIMEFWKQYSKRTSHHSKNTCQVITIEKNYRSSQEILDIAEHIIEKNTERLVSEIPHISKHLTAENPQYKTEKLKPALTEYYNVYHQELGIIKKIEAIQKKGIPLSDVAVIYQNHSQVENILKICEQKNIPVRVKETHNILDIPIIQQCLELLLYFEEEAQQPFSREDILFRSLFFSFLNVCPSDISRLALLRRNHISRLHNEKKSPSEDIFLKSLLQNPEKIENIPHLQNPEKIKKIGEIFAELEKDYHNKPLIHFVESIFEKTGALQYVMEHHEKSFLLRAFSTLFQFLKNEVQKNTNTSVADILNILRRMQTHGLSLPIQKILYEKDGIHFITAHSSKGLEFEYVFLLGVEKKIWDKKRGGSFSFPDTLTLSNEGDFLEEKRRLFFVALTRAKRYAEVSYCGKSEEGKECDPSIFVSEMAEKITPQKKEYSEDEINEYQMQLLCAPAEKNTPIIEPEIVAHILENYKMSATHLNKYLACPLSFYFENLLRIPSAMSPHAAFGTAIHNALEKAYRHASATGAFENETELLHAFHASMNKSVFAFEKKEFEKFYRHGEEVLQKYYEKKLHGKIPEKYRCEYQISTHIGHVPATGNLDRIDFLDAGIVRVVDYKTGNPNNQKTKEKLERPSEKNNFLGGDYWRQMVFYKLLLENNPKEKWHMREGIFDFVEPDTTGTLIQKVFEITPDDTNEVQQQVENAYTNIMNMNFEGCHKEDCHWCGRFL